MTLAPGTPIGKYEVVRKLAEGGMAELYLCNARGVEGFTKDVVIKRIRPALAVEEEFVQMFIAEARIASRLNHPNVVQIFDFDKHEDTYYLAMEYVRGGSLWELRKRCRAVAEPLRSAWVAHVGACVARGLAYAHRATEGGRPLSVVHRDVTPHNVLLSFDGAVKLTDFGIAKASNKLTVPGVLKGKFAYMSPEQARGDAVDARTDVFALGIVLWEMLTGGRLFEGDTDTAVLRAVQHSVIVPPARLNPDVPADLDAVVMKALERQVASRFQTAAELERALAESALEHARSLEDTDVGALVRRLLLDSSPTEEELPPDRSGDATVMLGAASEWLLEGRPPEPTAMLPGVRPRSAPLVGELGEEQGAHGETRLLPVPEVAEPEPVWPDPQVARPRRRGLAGAGALVAALAGLLAAGILLTRSDRGATSPPAAGPLAQAERAPDSAEALEEELEAKAARASEELPAGEALPRPTRADEAPPPVESSAAPAGLASPAPKAGAAPGARLMPGVGSLVVRASPYATVLLDGRRVRDVQGTATLRLPAGRYRLTFEHPMGSKDFEILIEDQKSTFRDFKVPRVR